MYAKEVFLSKVMTLFIYAKKRGAKLKLIMFYSKVLAEIKQLRMHG